VADTKEADSKRKEPAKQGLHGWKAALAVFGCGTLAAFGLFGVLVAVLSLFVSSVSSGISGGDADQPIAAEQRGVPREELEPGGLEICGDYMAMEAMTDIRVCEVISISHMDPAEDPGYDPGAYRSVSGECKFTVKPDFGNSALWYFDFSFEAIIHDPVEDRDQMAEGVLSQFLVEAPNEFSQVESQGAPEWADSAQSYYGKDQDGVSQYLVVAQTRSAVYQMVFSADPDGLEEGQVSEFDFERQAEQLGSRLDNRFFSVIPE
jgi:hypothetical protein